MKDEACGVNIMAINETNEFISMDNAGSATTEFARKAEDSFRSVYLQNFADLVSSPVNGAILEDKGILPKVKIDGIASGDAPNMPDRITAAMEGAQQRKPGSDNNRP